MSNLLAKWGVKKSKISKMGIVTILRLTTK